MKTWFRKLGMGALALTLAGVLGGCDDSGRGLIRLFFGINGSGNCDRVVVAIDLHAADAILARNSDGSPQCDIAAALDASGCNISFAEDSRDLIVTITGCTIPGVASLFSCFFEDVDISELQETVPFAEECRCITANCDNTPPICIGESPDPEACEDCTNGIDDDGNGLIDCDDPNCVNDPACADVTTTSTTTTSSSTTTTSVTSTTTSSTTTSSTTTSTTMPFDLTCTVTFRLADDVTVGSLQWETDYGDVAGRFLGSGGDVECTSLIEGALSAFNDQDADKNLTSGLISLSGFTGPVNIAECIMAAQIEPSPSDFVIEVTEAASPDLTPLSPLPDVIVTTVVCEGVVTTTTLGPTTTLPPTTTTLPPGNDFDVVFVLDSASASVGSLQFDSVYTNAPGDFQGAADLVSCTNNVAGSLFAPNNNTATRTLSMGWINLSGFAAPTNLATCRFNSSGDAPVPGNFPVSEIVATDPNFGDITVGISVQVNAVP